MKTVIITVIVWVIIIGFFITGVRVMATSPDTMRIQSAEWTNARNLREMNVERMQPNDEDIRPAGDQGRVLETVGPQ
jgi:hypothetical protein